MTINNKTEYRHCEYCEETTMWKREDHSFDHVFGTETIFMMVCQECGEEEIE